MEALTEKDKKEIISRSIYWDEVANRDNPGDILQDELMGIIRLLRTKILWVLKDAVSPIKNHTARDAYNLAQSMWAQKLGTEDCFDFVRRLLNELYELSNKTKEA